MKRMLIAGCGYVGGRLAELLVDDGGWSVRGLRRRAAGLPTGVEGVAGDVTDPRTLTDLPEVDAVVYAVSPAGRTEADYRAVYVDGLRNLLNAHAAAGDPPARIVLVTSTGVYGQRDGRWVDEETPPEPADVTGSVLVEAEALVADGGWTAISLRLGGIYGPGRDRTVRRVLEGEAGCPDGDRYGNRIHRDDAAGALHHLLVLPDPAPVYVGVDRDPASLREVYGWIAERGAVPDPCAEGAAEPEASGGRRRTNKRCSSERLVDSGYAFRYPTFREGYAPLVDALTDGSGKHGGAP